MAASKMDMTTLDMLPDNMCYVDVCRAVDMSGSEWTRLPYVVRVLLEAAVREGMDHSTVDALINYERNVGAPVNFKPSRVLLQDLSGLPALLDLAAARGAAAAAGIDNLADVDARCPVDVVVDHAVQIDFAALPKKNDANNMANTASQVTNSAHIANVANMATAPSWPQPNQLVLVQQPVMMGNPVFVSPAMVATPMLSSEPHLLSSSVSPLMASVTSQPFVSASTSYLPTAMVTGASFSEPSSSSPPCDNPGLPVLESVCPFHQRLSYWSDSLARKEADVLEKQREKFEFLKWADKHFDNVTVIPPGTGVRHQSNLEYLARVVCGRDITVDSDDERDIGKSHFIEKEKSKLLFPDSCLGTDTHTNSVNGLGVLGLVGSTLDAEAVIFGHHITLSLPKVVGCRLIGEPHLFASSTDLVLLITKTLRNFTKDEKQPIIVEFTGEAMPKLSVSDRIAVATMSAEFNAISAFFPIDAMTMEYLTHTHRDRKQIECMQSFLHKAKLFNEYKDNIKFVEELVINLSQAVPMLSCSFSDKDVTSFAKTRIPLNGVKHDFWKKCKFANSSSLSSGLRNGCVLLSALASCSNASNPSVMLGAGLLAQRAVERGLSVPNWVKATLAPGSGVVTSYLQESGVMPYLHKLGFEVVGYGCATCDNNHKRAQVSESVLGSLQNDALVCCGLFSGNRHMEHRLESGLKANYLSSPMLVIAYSIAGRIDVDLDNEPLAFDETNNEPIFLKDIWPSKEEIKSVELCRVLPAISSRFVNCVDYGSRMWSKIAELNTDSEVFDFNDSSTMLRAPKYVFDLFDDSSDKRARLSGVRCLIKLGDNVTADMISPAGSIVRNGATADYLVSMGLQPRQFNSYGSRRGNFEVMMRGAFAHPRITNALVHKENKKGNSIGLTIHMPSGLKTSLFSASEAYAKTDTPLCVIAGANFGRGCNRDWAVRSLFLLGIKLVLAKSFDEDYRRHLLNMAILPVIIEDDVYEMITGVESIDVIVSNLDDDEVVLVLNNDMDLTAKLALNTENEKRLFNRGGVLKSFLNDIKRDSRHHLGLQPKATAI